MLLAAPPKSGKSLIASEIALALSVPFRANEERFLFDALPSKEDPKFPGLQVLPPLSPERKSKNIEDPKSVEELRSWKVLFVSLEMREAEVSGRLRQQLGRFIDRVPFIGPDDPAPAALLFPLSHVFGLPAKDGEEIIQDLRIIEVDSDVGGQPKKSELVEDFVRLRQLIKDAEPDVVIYDTLIQLHGINENDNILMKAVMRALRRISVVEVVENGKPRSAPIAHIVLHHTRKESSQYRAPLSPEMMRGAGAVHGVADLVMLARQDYRQDTLEVQISSRSSSIPNFYLQRDEKTLTHRWVSKKAEESVSGPNRMKQIILGLLKGAGETKGRRITPEKLKAAFAAASKGLKKPLKAGDDTIQSRFDELVAEGEAHIVKGLVDYTAEGEVRANAVFRWQNCWFAPGAGDGTEPMTGPLPKEASRRDDRPVRKKKKKSPHPK